MNTTEKEGYWPIVQGLRPGLNDGEEPNLLLLIELHRELPFVGLERLGTPAHASTGPGHPQARLGALLDQLPLKLGERRKDVKRQFATGRRRIEGLVETPQTNPFLF